MTLGGRAFADETPTLSEAELRLVPAERPVPRSAIDLVRRIDVHHHPVPPAYLAAVGGAGREAPPLRGWSPERSLADMDRAGVATAMLSIPASGMWRPDAAENRKIARACNEYMANLVQRHPGRFGLWAALPLADIDGSLAELAYAMDTLHADGVGLFTDYGSAWLGDARFAPVFAELERRRAVVYTHPTTAACCGNLVPGVESAVIEYATDTARTIASLLFSGTAARTPNVKYIFSHAGGTMPTLIERFVLMSRQPNMAKVTPDGVLPQLERFYYDVAQAANPEALGPLMKLVPDSQVVFGTDYPYRTSLEYVAGLMGCGLTEAQLSAIGRTNALDLVPRLR
jgi:predicted TIM-barrel fold metal-dependent hydrolase